jgi:hypothetical protein
MLVYNVIGTGIRMTYQSFNQPDHTPLVARKRPGAKHLPSYFNHSADGFETWLNRTIAQHAEVVIQASALMRAYRNVRPAGETRVGQAL